MPYLMPGSAYVIRVLHESITEFTLLDIPSRPSRYSAKPDAEWDLHQVAAKEGIFGSNFQFELEVVCDEHFANLPIIPMWRVMGFDGRKCCQSKGALLHDGHTYDCVTRLNVRDDLFKERLEKVKLDYGKKLKTKFPFNVFEAVAESA